MTFRTVLWTATFLLILSVADAGALGRKADRIAPSDKAARNLLVRITVADPYDRWKTMPGIVPFAAGSQPHGPVVTVYLNDTAYNAWVRNSEGPMPGGSILVIENYDDNRKLTAFGVMHKLRGYNSDGGDWYWLRATADGQIDLYGKVDACIACHKGAATRDYIVR